MDNRDVWSFIALVIWPVVVAVIFFFMGMAAAMPTCPTEDSCTVDYRDGKLHIERVTP